MFRLQTVSSLLEGRRWLAYDSAVQSPLVFPRFSAIHPTLRRLGITPSTELVIEGFPRSANTYAVVAFELANGHRPGVLAHHTHSSVLITHAVRLSIPVLLLVREPWPAVRSLCLRYPGLTPCQGLRRWIRFYECVSPLRRDLCIASFDSVIGDFGKVTGELNARFGLSYHRYSKTPDAERQLVSLIEHYDKMDSHGRLQEHRVGRPSEQRRAAQASLDLEIDRDRALRGLAVRANELFDRFVGRH